MRFASVSAFAAVLAFSAASLSAKPPVPRPARELSVVEANGKLTLLTSLKGKVVYVQFLFTTCPHCQALSGVLTKLSHDLGPQGFQALGVAFDDNVTPARAGLYARQFAGFPVGYASRATVESYLGMTDDDRFVVPQAVIVDRKGVIRAQTDVQGTENLQREDYLRTFITSLLKEGAAPKAATPAPASK
jgi:thiol-disulfide isomerase/thioredoxin